jgi:Fe-S cluster assembly protein SufD
MKPTVAGPFERFRALAEEARRADAPAWLSEVRARAGERFGELGLPTTRLEAWKYTDVAPTLDRDFAPADGARERVAFASFESLRIPEACATLVFVDGHLRDDLSTVGDLPEGVVVADLYTAFADGGDPTARERFATLAPVETEHFVALNTALATGGAYVRIPDGCALEAPIHVVYLAGGCEQPTLSSPRTLVVAGTSASATLVETFASADANASFTNAVAEISLGENARLVHYRVQREIEESAFHVGSTDVAVGRSASYASVAINFGGALARHDIRVALRAEGAECRVDGLYMLEGAQHSDTHSKIDHFVPHTTSGQIYKGVVDDASRAVFNGKVIVHEGAQKTEAHQTNKNLTLSRTARVDTKPELEIYADDVVCTHGATVGALDDDERFYLTSRGIDGETARALLSYGFAEEIVELVRVESLRHHLDAFLLERFQKGLKLR